MRLSVPAACAVTASVLALGLAGCGDSDAGTSTSAPSEEPTTTEASSPEEVSDLLGATLTTATAGEPGAVVESLEPDSGSRLKPGDVIVAVDGTPVASPEEVAAAVGTPEYGRGLKFRVVRGSRRITLIQEPVPQVYLGAEVRDAKGGERGALVVSVTKESPAASSGIRPGDVITAIDATPVEDVEGLLQALATHDAGDTVTVTVSRGSRSVEISTPLADRPT